VNKTSAAIDHNTLPSDRAVDLALVDLADAEAALAERVADLELDVHAYRELALQAIHALHDVTAERDRLRASHRQLHDEYRALREQLLRQAEAA
jgi:hypothetical protein